AEDGIRDLIVTGVQTCALPISRLANAHEFIAALPAGYATDIQEGGVNLSVGQRQLICIARAVLADPHILILDEATASVDTLTEQIGRASCRERVEIAAVAVPIK